MGVIQGGILDARGSQNARHVRLPNTFGKPHAARFRSKTLFTVARHPLYLAQRVPFRDRAQHRFIIAAAHDFHLTLLHQSGKCFQKIRGIAFKPVKQRPRKMHRNANFRVALENIQKGQVTVAVRPFKNEIKVPDRLVGVAAKYKVDAFHLDQLTSSFYRGDMNGHVFPFIAHGYSL